MFKRFSKIALIILSGLLVLSSTNESEVSIDSTLDDTVISITESNTMHSGVVNSRSVTSGVDDILYSYIVAKPIDVKILPIDDVKIKENQGWGADLVMAEFSDILPSLNEDEQKEQMLIDLTEPNILDGTEGNEVCNSATKTFMGYDSVTSKTSRQWYILNDEKYSWSDTETGFRMFGDRICIAIGQRYALPGDKVDVVMKNGSIIRCIVGDAKSTLDTDVTMSYQKYDGSVIEMIVDYNYFNGFSQYPEELKGAI